VNVARDNSALVSSIVRIPGHGIDDRVRHAMQAQPVGVLDALYDKLAAVVRAIAFALFVIAPLRHCPRGYA